MQGSAWIELLRRIPVELHDALAFGLVTGEEVVVQQVLKLESDFAIVRGRMSGTTVEGRVMMVPYAHMALAAFNKPMAEAEIQAIFGKSAEMVPGGPAAANSRVMPPLGATAAGKPSGISDPGLSRPPAGNQPKPPSKSHLLARLRERLAEKAK